MAEAEWREWKPGEQWKQFVGRSEKGWWSAVVGNTPFGLWD